jgi:hypothetical protein
VISNKNAVGHGAGNLPETGVAYFNLNKNDESLNSFKKLVTTYPNTQESDDAIEYIRNIFVENQRRVSLLIL